MENGNADLGAASVSHDQTVELRKPQSQERGVKQDWREAMWHLYYHVCYGVPRKETLRRMIGCGLSARDAIEEMRNTEREP